MALTLAQADLYSTNLVYRGVVEEFLRASPILAYLPFIDVTGNAYQYLRESTRSSANFYDPGDIWTENIGTNAQVTVALRILGGDADIDDFLKATRSNYTDLEAEILMEKVKSVKFAFLDAFYYGANATNAKEFDGTNTIIANADRINQGSGTTGAALSIGNLDLLIDNNEGGPPDLLVMPKAIRRRINAYVRANGYQENDKDDWGNTIQRYNGVPMYVDDSLVLTETLASGRFSAKTGGATGSIWGITFGTDGMFGIQTGDSIKVDRIGNLETKNAVRWRVKWYTAVGLKARIKLNCIDGITDVPAVS